MMPETLFLRYALPCSAFASQKGKIDKKTFDELERKAIDGLPVEREVLESLYPEASVRMKAMAIREGKDAYTEEIIRKYFVEEHNMILDGKISDAYSEGNGPRIEMPDALKELCKVHVAKILHDGGYYYDVEYENGERGKRKRKVLSVLVPGAAIGNRVSIHYGYAIERIYN